MLSGCLQAWSRVLEESLSALDAKVREELREDIRMLQRRLDHYRSPRLVKIKQGAVLIKENGANISDQVSFHVSSPFFMPNEVELSVSSSS
jgi:hypothetical protein